MKRLLVCSASLVIAVLCLSEVQAVGRDSYQGSPEESMASDAPKYFPEVVGRNLEGLDFQLPRDFGGAVNLVLVAFRREHQAMVDTWLAAAAALADSVGDLHYYELPVLSRGYILARPLIDGGMSAGIADLEARERTVTLYIDKSPFRDALGISNEDTIYVLVLGPEGRVSLMLDGAYSKSKGLAVERAVAKLLDGQSLPGEEEQAPN
jgi:hypothetical protein